MFRLPRMTATVALGAAVVGSIAIATPAQAAELGRVGVYDNSSWGAGWDACRKRYPATKSTGPDKPFQTPLGRSYTLWKCYDTANAT